MTNVSGPLVCPIILFLNTLKMGQTSGPETLVIHQKTKPGKNPEDFMQINICQLCPSYMFRHLKTHHQRGTNHSSVFFHIHLFHMEQPTTYFSFLLHDVQDIRNYQLINLLLNVLYKIICCTHSVMIISQGLKQAGIFNVLMSITG
jgi:hypothetical protein